MGMEDSGARRPDTVSQARDIGKKLRVFVADGSAEFCRRLEQMLSELAGIEILGSAQDPEATLREISRLRPDVLLLDVHLSGGGGMEVMRRAKRERWARFVVTMTEDAARQYLEKCARAGADYVLYKPEAQEKVREILGNLVRLSCPGSL